MLPLVKSVATANSPALSVVFFFIQRYNDFTTFTITGKDYEYL